MMSRSVLFEKISVQPESLFVPGASAQDRDEGRDSCPAGDEDTGALIIDRPPGLIDQHRVAGAQIRRCVW